MNITPDMLQLRQIEVDNKPTVNIDLYLGIVRVASLTRTITGSYKIQLAEQTEQCEYIAVNIKNAISFVCTQLNYKTNNTTCGDQGNRRIVVTTNHKPDHSVYYTLDICNMDNVFKSIEITEEQANAMILAQMEHEDTWVEE